jgi:hypothetical protein
MISYGIQLKWINDALLPRTVYDSTYWRRRTRDVDNGEARRTGGSKEQIRQAGRWNHDSVHFGLSQLPDRIFRHELVLGNFPCGLVFLDNFDGCVL